MILYLILAYDIDDEWAFYSASFIANNQRKLSVVGFRSEEKWITAPTEQIDGQDLCFARDSFWFSSVIFFFFEIHYFEDELLSNQAIQYDTIHHFISNSFFHLVSLVLHNTEMINFLSSSERVRRWAE